MREIFSTVQFAKPIFFWLLLTLPLLWFRFRDQRLSVMEGRLPKLDPMERAPKVLGKNSGLAPR